MKSTKLPTLYKRSNQKDNINQWSITIEGDSYYSTSGKVDMKQFQNEPTRCIGKNIGKSNETTPQEQALFEATQMWQKRKDLGYHEDIKDCDKKVYYSPMLATDIDKIKIIKYPILSQAKLDGMRCIIKSDGMWSRTGKEVLSAPHIFESIKHIFEIYPDLILDGELYTSNKDIDFNTIISCVRKTKPTEQDLETSKQYINYWVYDLPNWDNKDYGCKDRLFKLSDLLDEINSFMLVTVPTYFINNKEELHAKLAEYIEQGFEGQILRVPDSLYENKRSRALIKHKEFYDDEFAIISINEGIGKFANKAATCTYKTKEGIEFKATINGTMDFLTQVWKDKEQLIGKTSTVKYFEKTVDGSLRFPKVINIDRHDI